MPPTITSASITLVTQVDSPQGIRESVIGSFQYHPIDSSNQPDHYTASIHLISATCLGDLRFEVKKEEITNGTQTFQLPYVYITYMANNSQYTHVGNALHELAFRVSLLLGCEGRIRLDAVWGSDYFHYSNGFRYEDVRDAHYLLLAKKLIEAEGKRINSIDGGRYCYLPRKAIEANLEKFGITHALPYFETESAEARIVLKHADIIMAAAQKKSLLIYILLGLREDYGFRGDMPLPKKEIRLWTSIATQEHQYRANNPSLFCKGTRHILDETSRLILEHAPYVTAESELLLMKIFLGGFLFAMVYQDVAYQAQARYGHEFLISDHGSLWGSLTRIVDKKLNHGGR